MGGWKDDHGLLVMVLGQRAYEARLRVVGVAVGVAVLVANGGWGHVAAGLSGAATSPTTAAAAGCAARNERVVSDVRRVAQARLLAVVRTVSIICK